MRIQNGLLLILSFAVSGCQAGIPTYQGTTPISAVATAELCPKPGSSVQRVRTDNGRSAGSFAYLEPIGSEKGLCVIRVGPNRRGRINLVGRSIDPDAQSEHIRMQAGLFPLAVGATTQGYVNLPERTGLRSMQFQVTYDVLREEAVTVPAGAFNTFVVEERERNGSCVAIWTAWLDKQTQLPIRIHSEITRCSTVSEFDAVASHVTSGRAPQAGRYKD